MKRHFDEFFNRLRSLQGSIWVEGDDLKLSTPKELQTPETKNFLIAHKAEIIDLLRDNHIESKEEFHRVRILAYGTTEKSQLSFAQERLYFIEKLEEGTDAYHLPEVFELEENADTDAIEQSVQKILSRHEVLRSTIHSDQDGNEMILHNAPLAIDHSTISAENYPDQMISDIKQPFDLTNDYPIRVRFYTIEETGRKYLSICTHHIASDGWSINLFRQELAAYYEAYLNEAYAFELTEPAIQYGDFAGWQKNYLTGTVLEEQLS
ncbi:MAG: condensation domain-containing protein, partial [Cyclobacteriaceae bacterium]